MGRLSEVALNFTHPRHLDRPYAGTDLSKMTMMSKIKTESYLLHSNIRKIGASAR